MLVLLRVGDPAPMRYGEDGVVLEIDDSGRGTRYRIRRNDEPADSRGHWFAPSELRDCLIEDFEVDDEDD